MKKQSIVISCIYDSVTTTTLPVGFSWADVLTTKYSKKYKLTVLLHGECIKFGLNSSIYFKNYKSKNPYSKFLKELKKRGVKIVICKLCLNNDGFNVDQLLDFVEPIPFSIDFIARSEKKGKTVVYDAKLN